MGKIIQVGSSRLEEAGAVSLKQRWTLTDTLLENRSVRNSESTICKGQFPLKHCFNEKSYDSIVKVPISKRRLFLCGPKLWHKKYFYLLSVKILCWGLCLTYMFSVYKSVSVKSIYIFLIQGEKKNKIK